MLRCSATDLGIS